MFVYWTFGFNFRVFQFSDPVFTTETRAVSRYTWGDILLRNIEIRQYWTWQRNLTTVTIVPVPVIPVTGSFAGNSKFRKDTSFSYYQFTFDFLREGIPSSGIFSLEMRDGKDCYWTFVTLKSIRAVILYPILKISMGPISECVSEYVPNEIRECKNIGFIKFLLFLHFFFWFWLNFLKTNYVFFLVCLFCGISLYCFGF